MVDEADNIEELVTELTDGIAALEVRIGETQKTLKAVNEKLDDKTNRVKKWLIGLVTAGTVAFGVGGALWYDNHLDTDRLTRSCQENRATLKQVIEIAIADRQPLSSSTPETVIAIERDNADRIRPLREKLLALEGTQPQKC